MRRFREIMSVLGRNGLGFIFIKTAITRNAQKELSRPSKGSAPSIPERIRLSCEQLGPTFVKLGQILSTHAHGYYTGERCAGIAEITGSCFAFFL